MATHYTPSRRTPHVCIAHGCLLLFLLAGFFKHVFYGGGVFPACLCNKGLFIHCTSLEFSALTALWTSQFFFQIDLPALGTLQISGDPDVGVLLSLQRAVSACMTLPQRRSIGSGKRITLLLPGCTWSLDVPFTSRSSPSLMRVEVDEIRMWDCRLLDSPVPLH